MPAASATSGWSGAWIRRMLARSRLSRIGVENRLQVPTLSCIPVRDANDLETVDFDLLVAEHPDPGGGYGVQVFRVVPKLLVISRDEVDAVGRGQFLERLGGPACVDGGAVVEISGDKDGIGLLVENLRHHAAKEVAVADVPEVEVADQRRFPAVPFFRQVGELNGQAGDSGQAGVKDAKNPSRDRQGEQDFHREMKIQGQPGQVRNGENRPRRESCDEEETENSHPDGCDPVKDAQGAVRVAEGENGGCDEAH